MKDKILKEMKNGISLTDLSNLIGQSEKKVGYVIHLLRNEGYDIRQRFDSEGNIIYNFGYNFTHDNVVIENRSNEVRALIISDIHIGRSSDGIDNLCRALEYAKENDIHIVFNLGDLFQGLDLNYSDKDLSMDEQLDRFFKFYPYNSKIVHFNLFGNHDMTFYTNYGYDVSKKIISRPDIISLGYGTSLIGIGNDLIGFKHDLCDGIHVPFGGKPKYVFKGHTHRFEYNDLYTNVPALLDIDFYDNLLSCGFLDVNFLLNDSGLIDNIFMKYIALLDNPRAVCNVCVEPKIKKKI